MAGSSRHDVVIVGGGPAGLSAALLLGRCLRDVLVCDEGRPRNERSRAMHGFLGEDGVAPADFLQRCRDQLKRYHSVSMVSGTVVDVSNEGSCFLIREKAGREWRSRTVLIATGLVDHLPEIPDIAKYYGTSVFHCPYCDAWENRGLPMGVISGDEAAAQLAEELLAWSDDVTLFSHREDASDIQKRLVGTPVKVVPGEVTGLEGEGGILHFVCVGDRRTECRALFFSPAQAQHSTLAQRLGCRMEEGMVGCGPDGGTGVAGLFVAGNVSGGVQMAIVAAAEGVKAAVAIHEWLSRYALSRI